jgi:AraC family transcriptional regulator, regulatory protein of adaptative response / methylated-DNA-[protein]-cysteine methyltransferase
METLDLITPRPDEMRRAFLAGDPTYDGIFVTGVKTTGIFCRPSCPARKPLPGNVEFFSTAGQALDAGYRPCKRCEPLQPAGPTPAWAKRLLQDLEADPTRRWTDADLRTLGVDGATARRYFLKRYGMTFHAFARAQRLGQAFMRVRAGDGLDDVAYDSGWESLSGFRDAFGKLFGSPPRHLAKGALFADHLATPIGPMIAVAGDDGLRLLEFFDRRAMATEVARLRRRAGGEAIVPGRHDLLQTLRGELAEYFAGSRREFTVPLAPRGTPFEEGVWAQLRRIPYGATRSYEDVARAVGEPGAVRAVGRANGANNVCIVIPCHRVVRKSGELGGYGGGLWRKRLLLAHERGERALGPAAGDATG